MKTNEKIAKAKAKLMLEHPYIGAISTTLKLENDSKSLTFSSDGVRLIYNDEYFEKIPVHEIEFALANGAIHAILKHQERVSDRVGRIWQAATDLVVNVMLVKNDFILPPYVYYDERFDGMYAEEIYDVLKDEMINNQSRDEAEVQEEDTPENKENKETKSNNQQKNQEQELHPESLNKEEEKIQEELKEIFEQIFQKYKRQGDLPEGIKFVVPEHFSQQIDWRETLYRHIAEFAKSTYSFFPPNKKYLYRGVYLPSLSSDLLRIVIAIDTSGSIDENLLSIFLGETSSIMQSYPNYEIDIITADAKVQSHRVFSPGEMLEYELQGAGGTDFRPVFEYIDQHIDYPTILLYFTDGMGIFPEKEPYYNLLWVMPSAKEVPFGETIIIEEN
ncbi:MAG: hypothetical protein HF962_02630 [Sulfurovum sp.]|nr:hypothetical protein [Sulfurovum sp.]